MRLAEKYRPKTLEEMVGQDKAVGQVRGILGRGGAGGRAFWLSGPSGVGKTTLARILAGSIADPLCVVEFDSADDFGAAELDRMRDSMGLYGLGLGGRAFIINEAHGLRKPILRALLGVLERLPGHVTVVFTTTKDGEEGLFEDQIDASPLLSRCTRVSLTSQGMAKAGAAYVQRVAQAEHLDGQPIEAYVRLMQRPDVKNNLRAALALVESGAMIGGASGRAHCPRVA